MILCATDFSPLSGSACRAAAALAHKTNEPLVVVHVASDAGDAGAVSRLSAITGELTAAGIDVEARMLSGVPHEAIAKAANDASATLIVIGAAGETARSLFGGTADRLVSTASVPVLVVREGLPVDAWTRGERTLRVAVAGDLSPISDAAASWASTLSKFGPAHLTAIHVEWPAEAYDRLGIEGPMPIDRTHPIVEDAVRRELEAMRRRMNSDPKQVDVLREPPSADAPAAILRMAKAASSDLLVIGHRRERSWRVWEGSVARAVVRSASISVACIADVDIIAPVEAKPIHCIVAATDLSSDGNAAVAYALSVAPTGSRVVVVHVLDHPLTEEERARVVRGLSMLTSRRDTLERRIETRVELVEGEDIASAIVDATRAENADLLCIAARGRSRLPRVMLGSVAQQVLLISSVPVVVVP